MPQSLIDKYGRFKVHQVVATFYDHVLSSPRLAHYFDHIDIQGLVDHQAAFLRGVMGDQESNDSRELERAHASLGITEEDFDEMIRLLVVSLERYEMAPEDVVTIRRRYETFQRAIVAQPNSRAQRSSNGSSGPP